MLSSRSSTWGQGPFRSDGRNARISPKAAAPNCRKINAKDEPSASEDLRRRNFLTKSVQESDFFKCIGSAYSHAVFTAPSLASLRRGYQHIRSSQFASSRNSNQIMPTQSSPPPILFDLDGTLIDTVYQHVTAWSAALLAHGVQIPDWKIHRRIGMSGKSLAKQLLREPEVRKRRLDLDKAESRHDSEFLKASRHPRLLPGAQDLLKHLTANNVPW